MPPARATRLIMVAAVLTATSCGPTLYYGFPRTRTYEYERRVLIMVGSDPAGATIMTPNGRVLGHAPLIVEEKVRVRRSQRFRRTELLVLGSLIDLAAAGVAVGYYLEHGSGPVGAAGLGLFLIGIQMPLVPAITHRQVAWMARKQSLVTTGDSERVVSPKVERVVPRTAEFVARWEGLAATRVQLVLPETRAVTLRLPRTYTFEEALVLWARETAPPPNAENLYRIGQAYRSLAFQGGPGARERAIGFLIRYLQRHPDAEHVEEARRALEELRRLEGRER